jgi:hypothetical protein
MVSVALFLALVGPTILPFGLVAGFDIGMASHYSRLGVTEIGDLAEGVPSKVFVNLDSAGPVALGGAEFETDEGWSWEWNRSDVFEAVDQTGRLRVSLGEYYHIEPTAHPAPWGSHGVGSVYLRGDAVSLYGSLRREGNQTIFSLVYIGPGDWLPRIDLGSVAVLAFVASSISLPAAWGWLVAGRRRASHVRSTDGLSARALPPELAKRDEGLPWIEVPPSRLAVPGMIGGAIVLGLGVAIIFAMLLYWHPAREDLMAYALALMIIIPFMIFIPVYYPLQLRARPLAYAVSSRGMHFWYETQADRLLNWTFLPWKDVDDVGRISYGDSSMRGVLMQDGEKVPLERVLPKEQFATLVAAWRSGPAKLGPAKDHPAYRQPEGARPFLLPCLGCGSPVDPKARFCDTCGRPAPTAPK